MIQVAGRASLVELLWSRYSLEVKNSRKADCSKNMRRSDSHIVTPRQEEA